MRDVRRLVVLAVLTLGLVGVGATPAGAGTSQISGTAFFDPGGVCDGIGVPSNFFDYPPIVMSGDLQGCWYTDVLTSKDNGAPSGVYLETGQEMFVPFAGTGSFTTTYKFESKWAPDVSSGVEVKGRCQHPIVAGTGEFVGVSGRVDFKDVIANGTYVYRGHLKV